MKATSIFIRFFLIIFFYIPVLSLAQGSTMSDPIVMGNYGSGSHTFNDSRSNRGYGNEYATPGDPYRGQQSEDIFYRFVVQGQTEITVSTCASDFDTYIHLLKRDGEPLEHNDDNGPLCVGSRASIKTTLPSGAYFLVVEGYGSASGLISTSVTFVVQPAVAVAVADTRNFTKVWEATAPERDPNLLMQKSLSGNTTLPMTRSTALAKPTSLKTPIPPPVVPTTPKEPTSASMALITT